MNDTETDKATQGALNALKAVLPGEYTNGLLLSESLHKHFPEMTAKQFYNVLSVLGSMLSDYEQTLDSNGFAAVGPLTGAVLGAALIEAQKIVRENSDDTE